MINKINDLLARVEAFAPTTAAEVEEFRIKILGKKGELTALMDEFKSVPAEQKRELGQKINALKQAAQARINELKASLQSSTMKSESIDDMTRPGAASADGTRHPISIVKNQIVEIFSRLGYTVAEGPEIEDDWHVFSALNFPPEHPARDMQDTLYITDRVLLRTHTSSVQVRTMLKRKPPLAIIGPGKVYRRDSDVTHTPMFHQIEGLLVDKHVTMADLRGTLTAFVRAVFGEKTRVRFRPSFFPFTEPSVEVDMSCTQCGGHGHVNGQPCRVCKGSGWLEILGSGMVDPAVFTAVGYDPDEVTGFAFGLGVERIAMLKYGLTDLRMNFENDVRFLHQFPV